MSDDYEVGLFFLFGASVGFVLGALTVTVVWYYVFLNGLK